MPKTILIVEDNELNMRLFNDLLQANGYDTIKSVDGSDAIELVKVKSPDLIIWTFNCRDVLVLKLLKT